MHAPAPISGGQLGVVAAAGPTGIRENEDALDVVHERRGLREVRRAGAVLNHHPITLTDNAARAPGDFGYDICAKALDDLVEGAGHGSERGEFLDQAVAPGSGFPALDRLAVAIDGPGREIAF